MLLEENLKLLTAETPCQFWYDFGQGNWKIEASVIIIWCIWYKIYHIVYAFIYELLLEHWHSFNFFNRQKFHFLSIENIWIKHYTSKMGHKTWAAIAMDWVRLPSDRRPGRAHFPSDMQYVFNGTSNYNSPKFLTPTTLSPSLSHRFKIGSRPYEFSNQNSFGNTRFGNIEFEIWIFICKYMSTKH